MISSIDYHNFTATIFKVEHMSLNVIRKYFPLLGQYQIDQFAALEGLYKECNEQLNVISRKDIENLYVHHVLHSLAIAKFIHFRDGTKIIDLGTGGGFPGIPLAIYFPECQFLLVDSINKKLIVIEEVVRTIGLQNVETRHSRVEDIKEKCEFVVTRAVAKVDLLLPWTRKVLGKTHNNIYPNGLIALKGDLKSELELISKHEYKEVAPLNKYFQEPYFEEKFLLYIQG